jgi:hypothetical protein
MSLNIYHNIQQLIIEEATSIENLLPYFISVTDVDDSPDLTDIHPRDREDMNLNFIPVDSKLFPKTKGIIDKTSYIRDAYVIGLGPMSQLHTHVDEISLPPYSEIDWLSVYIGMFVPSYDANKIAVKVGETVYDHSNIIIFDTQIPHSAWNWTDKWWISVRLAVYKTAFQ